MAHEEAITSEIVAQAHVESKAIQLFVWADTEDRAARFNKYVTDFIDYILLFTNSSKICSFVWIFWLNTLT